MLRVKTMLPRPAQLSPSFSHSSPSSSNTHSCSPSPIFSILPYLIPSLSFPFASFLLPFYILPLYLFSPPVLLLHYLPPLPILPFHPYLFVVLPTTICYLITLPLSVLPHSLHPHHYPCTLFTLTARLILVSLHPRRCLPLASHSHDSSSLSSVMSLALNVKPPVNRVSSYLVIFSFPN